jgi:dienelactone hydrolase
MIVRRLEEPEPMPEETDHRYDPFARGRFPVGVRTIDAFDSARSRRFPCEIWYPAGARYTGQDLIAATQDVFTGSSGEARRQKFIRDATPQDGTRPLILFSHSSGGDRRQSTFLCTHLSSHGYVVTAMDHSERVAAELARQDHETSAQRATRAEAWISNRVPDVRFLLSQMVNAATEWNVNVDPTRIGIVGHSFGGWTALAAPDAIQDIRAVAALAPAGASKRKRGILPVELSFAWARDVSTLYLVAENDTALPLEGMYELFERTPSTKRMAILRRADHSYFMDDAVALHEALRTTPLTGDLAEMQRDMQPATKLCSEQLAHSFVRGLTVCHMDAALRGMEKAQRFWLGDLESELAGRGILATVHR